MEMRQSAHPSRESLESLGRYNDDTFESKIHLNSLDCEIDVLVQLDEDQRSISYEQVASIVGVAIWKGPIESISQLLYEHWENTDNFRDYHVESASEAMKSSRPSFLLVKGASEWPGRVSLLYFDVPWDSEHGAGVFFVDGDVRHLGDVDSPMPTLDGDERQ